MKKLNSDAFPCSLGDTRLSMFVVHFNKMQIDFLCVHFLDISGWLLSDLLLAGTKS